MLSLGTAFILTMERRRTHGASGMRGCRRRRGASNAFSSILVLFLIECSIDLAWGAPYRLLTSSSAKCFELDAPRDVTLAIRYQAPGAFPESGARTRNLTGSQQLVNFCVGSVTESIAYVFHLVLPDDTDERKAVSSSNEGKNQVEGIDGRFNERQRRQQLFAARKLRDMNVLITERDRHSHGLPLVHPGQRGGTGRVRTQLETREGVITFKTSDKDGIVECCVQAFSATPEAPSRVSLQVTIQPAWETEKERKADAGGTADIQKLSMHSSLISADLTRFEQRTKELMASADQAREREKDFHGQSVKLNRAVKYWPIFRMLVLLVGGYVQVSHVVRYMKSRHIY